MYNGVMGMRDLSGSHLRSLYSGKYTEDADNINNSHSHLLSGYFITWNECRVYGLFNPGSRASQSFYNDVVNVIYRPEIFHTSISIIFPSPPRANGYILIWLFNLKFYTGTNPIIVLLPTLRNPETRYVKGYLHPYSTLSDI
jgi:hypothetical protein